MNSFSLNGEDKEWLFRMQDFVSAVKKYKTPKFTKFCDARNTYIFENYFEGDNFVNTLLWGGFDESERKVIGFFPDFLTPEKNDFPIKVITACGNGKASHRDYLGALLSLGISRETLGDILVFEDYAVIFALSNIADFIAMNLKKIGSQHITAEVNEVCGVSLPPRRFKEINGTVPSMRLDCVAGLMTNLSRGEIASLIGAERVFVNYAAVTSASAKVTEGDILSVRGFGKAVLKETGSVTKKGRIHVVLNKYI